jgi:hypothetical protein
MRSRDLEQLRHTAKRLECYAVKVREKVWSGNRDDLLIALADVAETGEIARRFYSLLQQHISATNIAITHTRAAHPRSRTIRNKEQRT